jgi:hypothetical protein
MRGCVVTKFRERMLELRLTEKELVDKIYREGQESKKRAKNPYLLLSDIRAYCTWQAGVSDR